MNKAQKELLAKCDPYPYGTPFDSFYIIPSGKLYTGFWGKNGFNRIYLVLCDRETGKFYKVGEDYQCDVVNLPNNNYAIDIKKA